MRESKVEAKKRVVEAVLLAALLHTKKQEGVRTVRQDAEERKNSSSHCLKVTTQNRGTKRMELKSFEKNQASARPLRFARLKGEKLRGQGSTENVSNLSCRSLIDHGRKEIG